VQGELPQISWESTKVLEEGSEEEAPAGAATSGSRTIVVRKKEKKLRLDVFDRAAETKKPVFVYFTAENCNPCRTMEKLVLRQKQVTDAAKGYHSVQIVTDFVDPDLLKAYKVRQAPTIVLFNYDGEPSTRMDGKQPYNRVAEVFRRVAERNRKKAEGEKEGAEKAEAQEEKQGDGKRGEKRDLDPEEPPPPGDEAEGGAEAKQKAGQEPAEKTEGAGGRA
jgi:thioredoxin-like negative regulator of GroEL